MKKERYNMKDYELQELTEKDFEAVSSWLADPADMEKVCANLFSHPLQKQDFLDFYINKAGRVNSRICYKWVNSRTGKAAGMLSFTRIEWEDDYGHIGCIAVDPEMRGQGIGKALITEALKEGFTRHNMNRIDLYVNENNPQARRLYKRLGFQSEGIARDIIKMGNQYLSWEIMSLLRKEWESGGLKER